LTQTAAATRRPCSVCSSASGRTSMTATWPTAP